MGFISDLFGGGDGPKQRDVDQKSGKAEEQESARLRGLMKQLVNEDGLEAGSDYAEAGLIQFGSDSESANVFGGTTAATERPEESPEFQWTLGSMPENLTHGETLQWLSEQDGAFAEGGIDGKDAEWLQQWMAEAGSADHRYLFRDDFNEGADGWNWDEHINETNQTRLREFQDLASMYAPQLI